MSYIQLQKNDKVYELMKYQNGFLLITQIALRAKRTNSFTVDNIEKGRAMIGDYKNIGMSEMQYRTAKQKLEKWGFVTYKVTPKGTLARLINSDIYDINEEGVTGKITNKQQADNRQITTNNNDKKEKNEKEVGSPKFEEFRMQFPHARKGKKQEAMKQYSALVEQEVRRELDLLKLRIDIGEVDPKYLSACERRLRDFTPISKTIRTKSISLYRKLHKEDPKKEELYKRWIDNYPEQRKAGSEEFRKSQGINLSSFK